MSRFSLGYRNPMLFCFVAVLCCLFASASETVSGVVLNKTTGRPAPGDDIALLTVNGGSLEVSRGRTAKDGTFRLHSDVLGKHVLRVRHDNVIYQQEVTASTVARITVFDAARDVTGVTGSVTIVKIESQDNLLNVIELHSIVNESNPPLTQANDRNFKIFVPPKAILDSVVVQAPSSRAMRVHANPEHDNLREYAVAYPLFPGTTQFAVRYHLPYFEKTLIRPRLQYPTKLWTIMFPKSMNFQPVDRSSFHALLDQDGMRVQAAKGPVAGSVPGFVISGFGLLPRKQMPFVSEGVPINLLQPANSHAISYIPIGAQTVIPRRKKVIFGALIVFVLFLGVYFFGREWSYWPRFKSSVDRSAP